ncbi:MULTISPECIES: folylpolyglutamate synthase/dihydrofolate synthase family protein [unclassified Geobacillus]|uniref:bifunctional folylpolyglutamate synthase/dihydrofolate synthase n=1 Tax=unclassified Geobacillus TaxID=2642459 RepID=UPI000BE390F9|nr:MULTISPECIES: folylpolyglutamate synthase/dihydrofolate synthase family protein [unclassified Geobacillus]PDM41508.1 bifunctional folylpolyglutamate synthase/dihydrofolate synthase [Parageobacillus yumthangensis]RDV21339.1 bifunctional folylpolyglutamate synthase/dihydrofolate synthase [Parageobacillus toebii]TXK89942.1 bifunctional folylpolyglutamate synthase/dihydrofolate synthase [Parageobacillus sp. SY1]PUF90342.1 bifunctional folylpolyglutamate synthase/dihydrofolate synthase [Geobacill
MIRTYEEALEWIHGRLRLGIKPGLKRMEWLMDKLGHPERRIRAIHIAGTNGKGSTVSYLRHILQAAGYSVGTFTSPYVEQFNERISVNGKPIRDKEIVELVQVIQPLAEELEKTELGAPTEFEVITAMMFYYFGKKNIQDVVIIEAGLGGRFDSTNVIYPILSIITNIGYDHMNILGETLEKIALEKAGIIKSGVPVITAVNQPEAWAVIAGKAKSLKAKTYRLGEDFSIVQHEANEDGERFSIETVFSQYPDLNITMFGAHQVQNAAVAVMAADYLRMCYSFLIEKEHIYEGLEKAKWIGRFERISNKPLIIIDGAHNAEGIRSLVDTVRLHYPNKDVHVLFAALADKPLEQMIPPLAGIAKTITFTSFDFPRAASAEQLAALCDHPDKACITDWERWLKEKRKQKRSDDLFLITGSLYFIAEVRKLLL